MSQGADDVVKATAAQTEGLRKTVDSYHANPEATTGLSHEELKRRQKEAATPMKYSTSDGKVVEIKSSSRIQQIMSKGVNEKQHLRKRKEFVEKMGFLKNSVWFVWGAAFLMTGYIVSEFLYPQYLRVRERNFKMKIRREMAAKKYEEVLRQKQQDTVGSSPAGKGEEFTKLP